MFQINDKLGVTQIIRKEAIKKKSFFSYPLETETLNKVPI